MFSALLATHVGLARGHALQLHDVGDLHAIASQLGLQVSAAFIAADSAHQPGRSAHPGGGDRLVGALAAEEQLQRQAGHRVAGPWQVVDPRHGVQIDRAQYENSHLVVF
jgi:hypothetical protein